MIWWSSKWLCVLCWTLFLLVVLFVVLLLEGSWKWGDGKHVIYAVRLNDLHHSGVVRSVITEYLSLCSGEDPIIFLESTSLDTWPLRHVITPLRMSGHKLSRMRVSAYIVSRSHWCWRSSKTSRGKRSPCPRAELSRENGARRTLDVGSTASTSEWWICLLALGRWHWGVDIEKRTTATTSGRTSAAMSARDEEATMAKYSSRDYVEEMR